MAKMSAELRWSKVALWPWNVINVCRYRAGQDVIALEDETQCEARIFLRQTIHTCIRAVIGIQDIDLPTVYHVTVMCGNDVPLDRVKFTDRDNDIFTRAFFSRLNGETNGILLSQRVAGIYA